MIVQSRAARAIRVSADRLAVTVLQGVMAHDQNIGLGFGVTKGNTLIADVSDEFLLLDVPKNKLCTRTNFINCPL